ncbi:MAG: hypothetical protein JW985_00330 [Alphaproteobacteria bacterium]|nr:hypothetical protein [Alphaproteobacteria bacterium]
MKNNEETIDTAAEATVEETVKKAAGKIVSVELTEEQYAFLTSWQKTHENELGIEIPVGALVRKAVDAAMKSQNKPERSERRDGDRGGERKSFGDRPPRSDSRGGRDGGRPSFGSREGGRPSFGSRPSFGGSSRGPKFGGFNDKKNVVRKFDK